MHHAQLCSHPRMPPATCHTSSSSAAQRPTPLAAAAPHLQDPFSPPSPMRRLLPLTSSWDDDDDTTQQHDSAPGMASCLMQPWSGWGSSLSALLGCVMPREKPGSGSSAG